MKRIEPVKTAVLGCGNISEVYLHNLCSLFYAVQPVAVYDLSSEAAQKRARQFGLRQASSLEELLSDPEIEMVVNLTGPSAHYETTRQCLLAGKHCYCEKVLCLTVEQGRELMQLAQEKNLYLGAAPDTFLGAGLQTARKVLDAGLIGRVTSAVACVNRDHLLNSELYGFIRRAGGGFGLDYGIYYITALLALLGEVCSVSGMAAKPPVHQGQLFYAGNLGESWQMADSCLLAGTLQFACGAIGSVHFNGQTIHEEQQVLTLYGTEGILQLGDPNRFDGSVTLIRSGEAPCKLPFTHGYSGAPVYSSSGVIVEAHGHRGIGACEMAWAMRQNRRERASREMAVHALEVLRGIEWSGANGQTYRMTTHMQRPAPLASNYLCTGRKGERLDAEASLSQG